jgi:rubrerythrin
MMPTMTTHIVTKDKGGKIKLTGTETAEPQCQLAEDELKSFAAGADNLNGSFFADLLSAFLAHEQAGFRLYRVIAEKTQNPMLARKYREFGQETEEHIRILSDLIARLGGDKMYVSPAARMTELVGSKLLETSLVAGSADIMTLELTMLETVVLAETKDQANWSFLSQLAQDLPDSDAKQAIQTAVAQVEPQEDNHLSWAKDTWTQLVKVQTQSRAAQKVGEFAEKAVGKVKNMLE